MVLPAGLALPALESISNSGNPGPAGPSQSGNITGSSGGIAPVVIGGYKSDGSAALNTGMIPNWLLIGGAIFIGYLALKRFGK